MSLVVVDVMLSRLLLLVSSQGVFGLPPTRALTPRDEWDQDLFEEDSL